LREGHDATLARLFDKENKVDEVTVKAVEEVARPRGLSMATVAAAWCLHKGVNPIVGLKSKDRIDEIVGAAKVTLAKEEIDKLEAPYIAKPVTGF
jgi:versiconal hemiacetal acetate reductase